jgi:hypothetical protein
LSSSIGGCEEVIPMDAMLERWMRIMLALANQNPKGERQ